MSRPLLCLTALLAVAPAFAGDTTAATTTATPPLPYTLPGTMLQDRFFVEARAPSGQVLQLVTDTGGGTNLSVSGADKLGLDYTMPTGHRRRTAGTTSWPAYAGPWIPPPASPEAAARLPILVPPVGITFDGMLGAAWFGGRTWEWDYRAGTLRLLPDGALPKADPAHVVKLGFQAGDDGAHTSHFPRIPARIDGEELQFLFDTGATFRLGEAAAKRLGDVDAIQRAGSFITTSILERWHERHPDWPYLEQGDSRAPMILVPDVEIAGYRTGPVWFSARPDKAFHEFMAQWTDRKLDGALGGNAFRTFRITADYTAETAVFER